MSQGNGYVVSKAHRTNKQWRPYEDETLVSMNEEGSSGQEIAFRLRRTLSSVYSRRSMLKMSGEYNHVLERITGPDYTPPADPLQEVEEVAEEEPVPHRGAEEEPVPHRGADVIHVNRLADLVTMVSIAARYGRVVEIPSFGIAIYYTPPEGLEDESEASPERQVGPGIPGYRR